MSLPLVLVPGMMCDARLFAPQVAALSAGRTIMLADISAHDTVEALARDVLASAPDRFALGGLSMGGIVAMQVLAEAPERVDRIALLDTNPRAETEAVRQGREPQIGRVRSGRLVEVVRDELKPKYLADTPHRAEILDICMQMALDLGPEVFVRQSRALQSRPDQCETLRRAAVKALVMCGAEDRLCPPERHALIHSLLAGSDYEVIDNAGHLITLEQPGIVNAALKRWLEA